MDEVKSILDFALSTIAIVGAFFAVVKFKIHRAFERRYMTDIQVNSHQSNDGELYIICTYIIHNTGELPISLSEVSLDIYDFEISENELKCDESKSLVSKQFKSSETKYSGLMKISAGERSEFPIRGAFSEKKKVLFVYGNFKWEHKRKPSIYHQTILVGNTINA